MEKEEEKEKEEEQEKEEANKVAAAAELEVIWTFLRNLKFLAAPRLFDPGWCSGVRAKRVFGGLEGCKWIRKMENHQNRLTVPKDP